MGTAKTWGPFTGRQLTTVAVALIIGAVMLPSAVWAVDTFSNVAIEDPVSGAKAAVDKTNHLEVGDGSGALTVDGTVTSHETPLSQLVKYRALGVTAGGCTVLATAPTNKAIVLRTVQVDFYEDPSPGTGQFLDVYNDTTCATSDLVADVNPPSVGVTSLPFDPGVSSRTGFSVRTGGSVAAEVYAFGYTVPATSVPATAPAAASEKPNQ